MENFLSIGDVAKRLNRSTEMIRKYVRQGKLVPDALVGQNRLFKETTILEFENKQKVKK